MSFTRLQAPAEDGEWLAHPDPGAWRQLLDRNRTLFTTSNVVVGGLPLAEWRDLVRSEVASACGSDLGFGDKPVIVSGHQPELFHPGVWIKNFAAVGFARSVDGVGIHIIADSDLLKRTTVAVPAGTLEAPLVAHVPFDAWTGEEPLEDRHVRDEAVFRRFGEEAARYLSVLPFQTVFDRYWMYASGQSAHGNAPTSLEHRFSSARRFMERERGSEPQETTLSRCLRPPCRGFLHLAADVLLRATEYRATYNEELLAFRRKHKVRSDHHPAPTLESTETDVEVPFWAWKASGRRQRLFVAVVGDHLRLSAGDQTILELSLSASEKRPGAVAEALAAASPWKIRPRALMTTTFLRLGLADLFIHGLGGAKYDEWNDAVIRRFWKIEPPAYVMLTATRRLPLNWPEVSPSVRVKELQRMRRDLEWNPERYLDDTLLERTPICDWVEEKAALCEDFPAAKAERRGRFRRFREINESLREFVASRIEKTEAELRQAESTAAASQLMGSREFFFGFHPAESLTALVRPWLEWRAPPPARGSTPRTSL